MKNDAGQATTEVVLLFPIFFFFLIAFAKIFALLILVQKMEIASFYAARRWQLESHRNVNCEPWDRGTLQPDIEKKVLEYIGYGSKSEKFLGLNVGECPVTKDCPSGRPGVSVSRAQVWQVVTVTACTTPVNFPLYQSPGFTFCRTKYVPNRDRPISFILPGLQSDKAQASETGCVGS